MEIRPIDANQLYRIEKLLDTDIIKKDKVASELLEQVLYDIQHMPTLTPPNEPEILFCGICKSGEFLHNEDGTRNAYCGQCGHKIDWAYYDATVAYVEAQRQQEERLPEHLQAAYDDLLSFLKEGGQD